MGLLRCSYEVFQKHLGGWGLTSRQFFLIQAAIAIGLLLVQWLAQKADTPEQEQLTVNLLTLLIAVLDLGAFGITVGYKTVRSYFAITSFYHWFGILPLVTTGNSKRALRDRVHAELRTQAQRLATVYQREAEIIAALLDKPLAVEEVAKLEAALRKAGTLKRVARRNFYHRRDLAASPYLPISFDVHKSYKQYL